MKLPRVESLIITIFFLCIALWAISKCASKRDQLPAPEPEPDPVEEPAPGAQNTGAALPKLQNPPPPAAESTPASTTPEAGKPVPGVIPKLSNETKAAQPQPEAAETHTTLFVTIDGLKMRKEPNLKAPVVTRLKLNEPVHFLNEKSEEPQEINLGYETATDYWIKVRTQSGKEGWVFGAGLHYYKMKRKGVLE